MSTGDVKSLGEFPAWIAAVRAELAGEGNRFAEVGFTAETGSTNADLLAAARRGESEQTLVADYQSAGRGRLDRRWEAPPGANLLVSVLVRPAADPRRWPLLTTAMALAVIDAVGTGAIRWPNDVMVAEAKLAGVLAEAAAGAVVVGVGVNVGWPAATSDAPELGATSLALLGRTSPRGDVLRALLVAFSRWVGVLERDPAALAVAQRAKSATLGRMVRVDRGSGEISEGRAIAIDDDGSIVVLVDGQRVRLNAGDVRHLR